MRVGVTGKLVVKMNIPVAVRNATTRCASGHMSGAVVDLLCAVISSVEGSVRGKRARDTQPASVLVTAT